MSRIGIIGGSGLAKLENLEITKREMVQTPFGEPSGPLVTGLLSGREVVFLARHGYGHTIPPHKINYRANIWAFHELGVKGIIAAAAVGGIRTDMGPGQIAIPDQLIDYTFLRAGTYFDGGEDGVNHIDFTHPYSDRLRQALIDAAAKTDIDVVTDGVYAVTEGPRLETAAEINRLDHDGCTMVGMTAMPEAALARELEIDYATCAFVVNWAAGRSDDLIDMKQIEKYMEIGTQQLRSLFAKVVSLL